MNTKNADAVVRRLQGEAASRPRAMVISASAGMAVAMLAYRALRQPERE